MHREQENVEQNACSETEKSRGQGQRVDSAKGQSRGIEAGSQRNKLARGIERRGRDRRAGNERGERSKKQREQKREMQIRKETERKGPRWEKRKRPAGSDCDGCAALARERRGG